MRLVVKKELMPRSLKLLIYRCHLVNCIFFFLVLFLKSSAMKKHKQPPKAETEDAFSNAKCTWAFRSSIHNRGKEEIWEIHKCQNASVVPHIPQCFETFLKQSHFTNYNDFLQFTILSIFAHFWRETWSIWKLDDKNRMNIRKMRHFWITFKTLCI